MEEVVEFLKRLPLFSGARVDICSQIGQRLVFRYGETRCLHGMLCIRTYSDPRSAQIAACPAPGGEGFLVFVDYVQGRGRS